jgi:RimJ/RimL family protein N-acetyltransferase
MKDNYESILCRTGSQPKVLLVPYRPEHVERYHHWMQRPELLAATASEPLTLPEEYAMQETWYRDAHKCTCIILSMARLRDIFPELVRRLEEEPNAWIAWLRQHPDWVRRSLDAMIGDVNLFLSDWDDHSSHPYKQAEVDIMIAEPWARRQGCATEAVRCLLLYGAERFGIARYYSKIHKGNTASRALFVEQLHFQPCHYTECFQEYEYECVAATPGEMVQLLQRQSSSATMIRILPCPLSHNESDATKEG